jgi:GntR family transcriptional regulator
MRMDLAVDPQSPIPVYHQIAEALRYRIATGALRPGQRLPAVRAAAQQWNVHFHTVRRAYGELAGDGLVVMARAKGVTVGPRGAGPANALAKFVDRVTRTAAQRFGLSAAELARRVLQAAAAATRIPGPVYVVECSLTQCQDLAHQLRQQFAVDAAPWPLSNPDPLPSGEIVATRFHFNDLRRRCPERLAAVHFVSIGLDPGLAAIRPRAGQADFPLLVCDPDPEMTRNIAADVAALFAASRRSPRIACADRPPRRAPQAGEICLVSPRLWGTLPDAQRRCPHIREARYVFDADELLDLATRLGWTPVQAPEKEA